MCPPPSVARRALLGKPHTSYSLCARCSCSLTAGRGTCPTPECTDDDAAVEIMELRVRRSKCFLDAIAGGCRCPCKSAVCQARHECRLVGTRDGRAEAQPHYNVTDLEFAERLWKGFELWRHFPGSSAEELLSTALKEGWAVCTHARNVVREVKLAINVQNRIGRWNAAEEKLQIEMEKEKKRKAAELGDKVCAVCAKNEGQLSRRRLTLGEYRGWLCCSDRECRKAVRIMAQEVLEMPTAEPTPPVAPSTPSNLPAPPLDMPMSPPLDVPMSPPLVTTNVAQGAVSSAAPGVDQGRLFKRDGMGSELRRQLIRSRPASSDAEAWRLKAEAVAEERRHQGRLAAKKQRTAAAAKEAQARNAEQLAELRRLVGRLQRESDDAEPPATQQQQEEAEETSSASVIETADLVTKFKVMAQESRTEDFLTPLYQKFVAGQLRFDSFLATLLQSLSVNARVDAKARRYTDKMKKFAAAAKSKESGAAVLRLLRKNGIDLPVDSTIEVFQAHHDPAGCGKEGFRVEAVAEMLSNVRAAARKRSGESQLPRVDEADHPRAGEYGEPEIARGWREQASTPHLTNLKFDETDVHEELSEVVRFDVDAGCWKIQFVGDDFIPGVSTKESKVSLEARCAQLIQAPQALMDAQRRGLGDEAQVRANFAEIRQFFESSADTVAAAVHRSSESLETRRAELFAQELPKSIGALQRSIARLSIALHYDRVRQTTIAEAAGLIAEVVEDEGGVDEYAAIAGVVLEALLGTFRFLRPAGTKIIAFKVCDAVAASRSEVAALFVISGIKKEEFLQLMKKFEASMDFDTTSSDGGFEWLRNQPDLATI